MNFPPSTIPIPSYLLKDEELKDLIDRLAEIAGEADTPCERATSCVEAIKVELAKRGKPVKL